jgi:hypothetical protein
MIPIRPFRRRKRDILALALKNLAPAEELFCTDATYLNIKERVGIIKARYSDRTFKTIGWYGIQKIKRIA